MHTIRQFQRRFAAQVSNQKWVVSRGMKQPRAEYQYQTISNGKTGVQMGVQTNQIVKLYNTMYNTAAVNTKHFPAVFFSFN